jgi:hypothetical protein
MPVPCKVAKGMLKLLLNMKKLFVLMAAVAMMVSCGNKQQAGGGDAAADQSAKPFEFSVQNHITGTTGPNCFLPELGSDIAFKTSGEGDVLDVEATVKIKHSDKTEVKEPRETSELWISGRQDDNKDTEVKLTAVEENQKKLEEWFKKPAGEEVEITFKGKAPKADLEKLNGKECTNTLVF